MDESKKQALELALLELAAKWENQAKDHEIAGSLDCGTGSDVPYAVAETLREHSKALFGIVAEKY